MALAILALAAALAQSECADCEAPATRLPAVISEAQALDEKRRAENAVRVDVTELRRSTPALELTDVLAEVPGVIARDRHNFAQDAQISVRGFGARSAFGVRGLRIEYDGIPATAADGQSQVGHIDLASAGQVEVIRGPFAALYGNGGAFIRIDGSGQCSGRSALPTTYCGAEFGTASPCRSLLRSALIVVLSSSFR